MTLTGGKPWDGDITVTPAMAAGLISTQFPAITIESISILGSGWDNVAVLVNGEFVFRFPKKADTATLIETEARVLPSIAARVPLEIPLPEWIGEPSESYPWPFVGYRRLAGFTGCRAQLSRAARTRNAPILGSFLAQLHTIPTGDLDLPGDLLDRRDFAKRMPLMIERLDTIRSRGVVQTPDPWLDLFRELEHLPPTLHDAVVHGDLYARHLLVDENDQLTGVIDWGDVHAGDPAMDLMLMYGFLPGSARPEFEAAYGPVDDTTRQVARLRAAFHAVSICWYGTELPDALLAHEGEMALQFVLED